MNSMSWRCRNDAEVQLGRRDELTDFAKEYCRYLREALRVHDFDLQPARLPSAENGWTAAH
jgi:hypothetical protein